MPTSRTWPASGTEHILLGTLREEDGIPVSVLRKMGIDVDQIRMEVERNLPSSGNTLTFGDIPFTPRAKKVLEYAVEEARLLGHNYIGSEHLLLGLIREEEGIGGKILRSPLARPRPLGPHLRGRGGRARSRLRRRCGRGDDGPAAVRGGGPKSRKDAESASSAIEPDC